MTRHMRCPVAPFRPAASWMAPFEASIVDAAAREWIQLEFSRFPAASPPARTPHVGPCTSPDLHRTAGPPGSSGAPPASHAGDRGGHRGLTVHGPRPHGPP